MNFANLVLPLSSGQKGAGKRERLEACVSKLAHGGQIWSRIEFNYVLFDVSYAASAMHGEIRGRERRRLWGGETLARAMTIIETAKLNDLDPQAYLADVLDRIQDHRINKLDELLPWNWKAIHPEAGSQAA